MKTAQEIFKESERVIDDDTSDAAMIRFIASIQLDALESVMAKFIQSDEEGDSYEGSLLEVEGFLKQEIDNLKAGKK